VREYTWRCQRYTCCICFIFIRHSRQYRVRFIWEAAAWDRAPASEVPAGRTRIIAHGHAFSERELTFRFAIYAVARPSVVCQSSVSSYTLLNRLKFSAMFLSHLVSWPSADVHGKFYGDRPRDTPPSVELNARGVGKYSDFGPIESYISEMVQDRR